MEANPGNIFNPDVGGGRKSLPGMEAMRRTGENGRGQAEGAGMGDGGATIPAGTPAFYPLLA
ncbi:hypothetical protein AZH53_00545 [Methanomicrobiaceae archaeon CYW5]|uniref:hypothetical protein n=1 Tax=Methanovulcanius yangii TaxID=1789227 RepID=UPI0029CA9EC7|nr:hypothetical protein [Methanovulcanius yangii]MBT8506918.1 hypothetical protein [Methanovulcanius yangii]